MERLDAAISRDYRDDVRGTASVAPFFLQIAAAYSVCQLKYD